MYISEREWSNEGIKNHTTFCSATPVLFPPCKKFNYALDEMRKSRGIDLMLGHTMHHVDKDNKTVYFKRNSDGEEVGKEYDFVHFVPPMSPPKVIKSSALANAGGYVDVDQHTMQHTKYPNVFSLGDSSSVPAAKTAAATFSESPVVVHNILRHMAGEESNAKYDGYGSCPLFAGDRKLMLMEFKYGGESAETFPLN
jgi:NADPH-dependent 2,4-dienoyl-CoA reductase/sulfur reductase-like enzyme